MRKNAKHKVFIEDFVIAILLKISDSVRNCSSIVVLCIKCANPNQEKSKAFIRFYVKKKYMCSKIKTVLFLIGTQHPPKKWFSTQTSFV